MYKQVIVLRADLGMGRGKMVAQGSHASLLAYKKASAYVRRAWERTGGKKVVVKVSGRKELFEVFSRAKKLPVAMVRDAGLTQLRRGEVTAVGIGPAPEKEIDRITGNLKLL
ncbi:MAG: peptidyl-tRNA hydrolase [Candidatus Aenigmarchaeota archaeon]|nr:peptidyl-tRNA hydrolase [Candidatus Aenigmarchaeota archaeon]